MTFYYSGAKIFQGVQQNPDLSLGGYLSSTPVPSGRMNNLFGDISIYSGQNLTTETKAIILKNTLGVTTSNITLGFKYPIDNKLPLIFKLQMAVTQLDSTSQFMESIASSRDLPLNAVFYENSIADTTDNSLALNDMLSGAVYGIWVQRIIQTRVAMDVATENTLLQTLNATMKNFNTLKFILNYETV